MDARERFALNLVRCRRRSGMAQTALADRAGLHRTQISLLERAKRTPRADTLIRLADSLGVPREDLLRGIEWRPHRYGGGTFKVSAPPRSKG